MTKSFDLKDKHFFLLEGLLIVIFCFTPLFITFPFRQGLFLTWEGSYRIAHGQIPFVDFGVPFGVGPWLIPAFFMFLFGDNFSSLVYSQVFINVVFIVSFIKFLRYQHFAEPVVFLSALVFCLTFVIKNFWPYYNNTVVFYQFVSYAFVFSYLKNKEKGGWLLKIIGASFFGIMSIFTKQDIGITGLGILIILIGVEALYKRNFRRFLIFILFSLLFILLHVLPFLPYDFGYWFNHGQPPHDTRLRLQDFLHDILGASEWLKFYICVFTFIFLREIKKVEDIRTKKEFILSFLFSLGIVFQAMLIQVTSYMPWTTYLFFHGVAFGFVANYAVRSWEKVYKPAYLIVISLLVFLWWSAFPWGFVEKIFVKNKGDETKQVVSKYTRQIHKNQVLLPKIVKSKIPTLDNLKIPSDVERDVEDLITFLKKNYNTKSLKVLNASKLTFLAKELGYKTLTGDKQPLWYHVGVCFFDREYDRFKKEISESDFDLIILQKSGFIRDFFADKMQIYVKENKDYILYKNISVCLEGYSTDSASVYIRRQKLSIN